MGQKPGRIITIPGKQGYKSPCTQFESITQDTQVERFVLMLIARVGCCRNLAF